MTESESWSFREGLRLLVENSSDYAMFLLDTDGTIRTWNAGAQRIKGYTADEVIGTHFSRFYQADSIAIGHPQRELDIATEVGRFAEEGWRLRNDGSRFWASVTITALRDDDGNLRAFSKVTRDLTERKLQEDALRLAEEQFRLAFDAAPSGAALLSPDGVWLRINDALCRTLATQRDALIAQPFSLDLTRADGLPFDLFDAASSERRDYQLHRSDGESLWVQINVGAIRDQQGATSQLILQLEDVSARIAANQALQAAEQAKAAFVAVTSHELRSPLTSIIGFSTLLQRKWQDLSPERLQTALDSVVQQANRLHALVEDLLTLSTLDADGVRIQALEIPLVATILQVVAEVGMDVDVDGPTDLVGLADPMRLGQIMTNLLVNARRYGEPPFTVSVSRVDDLIRIVVADNGDGVPAEFVPELFERFTQADHGGPRRSSQGTGLGLSICRALAEAHGGSLEYEPAAGGGASFLLLLPAR